MNRAEYYLSQAFLDFFEQRVAESKKLALVSVLSTDGSTYSKAGMQMLVDEDDLRRECCLAGVSRVISRNA